MEPVKEKLTIDHVRKVFFDKKGRETEVIRDVSFSVTEQEFLVLLGPGLCGKTVLLNIIAGLEGLSGGNVLLDGEQIEGCQEKISMVFQKLGLFPWKNVMENVELGLKFKGVSKAERRERAQKFIDLVKLNGFEKSYPRQLSGGMKQRVGIARAYAADPEILILDEPFGQLDAQTRYSMEDDILKTWEAEKKTIVFVTNNIEEAVYLADRIVLLGNCPAQVKDIFEIDLPRPRNTMDEAFLEWRTRISDQMELSV